jgi:hypothetical protein
VAGSHTLGFSETTSNGHGVSFWGDENVLKLTVVMVAQLYEQIKTTGVYTLNEQTAWYVKDITVLFSKNKKLKF